MAKASADKSASPEMTHILEMMKKNRQVTFREVADAAAKKGLKKIYPISFGRAQLTLGIVRKKKDRPAGAAKRGPGRPPKAAAMPARRGPGRPPKVPRPAPGDPLGALTQIAEEMASLKRALNEIADIAGRF